MQPLNRRQFLDRSLLAAGALLACPRTGFSDIAPGVETVAAPMITGAERNGQPDIWAMEVNFKPVRMIQADVTDPKTGKSSREPGSLLQDGPSWPSPWSVPNGRPASASAMRSDGGSPETQEPPSAAMNSPSSVTIGIIRVVPITCKLRE